MSNFISSHRKAAVWAAALSLCLLTACGPKETTPESSGGTSSVEVSASSSASASGSTSAPVALTFPYQLAEGKLEVGSVFQYTGFNPDCGGKQGEDIAALQIKNLSVEHLESADLVLTLNGTDPVTFHISDLPAGAEAMVFSTENRSMTPSYAATGLTGDVQFRPNTPLMEEQVDFTVDNMAVTLTNRSQQELTNLSVYCHSVLNGVCFGGLTYRYPIASLPADGTASVEASDCYLGGAMVTRISVN